VRSLANLCAVLTLTLTAMTTHEAAATSIALQCASLSGSIVFPQPFDETTGGCSTGTFLGKLNDPIEGIVEATV
jgi:hypothetical protein